MEAVGADDVAAEGLQRLCECRRARIAQQCGADRRRAPVDIDGDLHARRALLHHRTITRWRTSRRWTCGTSRDAFWRRFFHGKPMPIQEHPSRSSTIFSRPRASTRRDGISKAARSSSRPGCRAASDGRRAAMTRWSGAPRSATTTNSIRRSAWNPKASPSTSRSGSTIISTARASCPTWRSNTDPTNSSNGRAGEKAASHSTPPSSSMSSAAASTTSGTTGSPSSTNIRRRTSPSLRNIR